MNQLSIHNDEGCSDVDELLHDFFKSEMPHPWPTLKIPTAPPMRRVGSFWGRCSGRMALAACVSLLVAGYLTLAAYFPVQQTPNGVKLEGPEVGKSFKQPRSVNHTTSPAVNNDGSGESLSLDRPMGTSSNNTKKPRKN
jgi:hypothetical protein